MIGFILRFFKGIVLGWLMSLVFFMVKRILAKALGGGASPVPRQHNRQSPPPSSDDGDIVETIWVGMNTAQLRTSFGHPKKTDATQTGEIWVYPNLNGQGTETAITIENGTVQSWRDRKIA